jgi:hypothetical protein
MNRFFIEKRNAKHDVFLLNVLEKVSIIYQHQITIIKENGLLIFLLSIFIWIFNVCLLYFLAAFLNITFRLDIISDFITNIIVISGQTYFDKIYSLINIPLLIIGLIGFKLAIRVKR